MTDKISAFALGFFKNKHSAKACYEERDIMGKECIRWIEEVWK